MECVSCGGPVRISSKTSICVKNPGCRSYRRKLYREKYPEKVRELKRKSEKKHRATRLLRDARTRALKAGLAFSLDKNDVCIQERCPVCDVVYNMDGDKDHKRSSPSIDRLVPSLGYVKGNILVMCLRCNQLKQDQSPEELLRFAIKINDLTRRQNGGE